MAAQENHNKTWQEADTRLENNGANIHQRNWNTYKLQEKLNNTIAREIPHYMAEHYQGYDPYPEWTQLLIGLVKETNLVELRPILLPEYEPEDAPSP